MHNASSDSYDEDVDTPNKLLYTRKHFVKCTFILLKLDIVRYYGLIIVVLTQGVGER